MVIVKAGYVAELCPLGSNSIELCPFLSAIFILIYAVGVSLFPVFFSDAAYAMITLIRLARIGYRGGIHEKFSKGTSYSHKG